MERLYRTNPKPKPVKSKFLIPTINVPKVNPEVLTRRLQFLLSDSARLQQMHAPLRVGVSPYFAEKLMWERQMRDLRRIYLAQYLQTHKSVIDKEREKQIQLFTQNKAERRRRREDFLNRLHDDQKRRALLQDRLKVEKNVTQSIQITRQMRWKINRIHILDKIEKESINFSSSNEFDETLSSSINLSKKISVPQLLHNLGYNSIQERSPKKSVASANNVFEEIFSESLAFYPEDAPEYASSKPDSNISESERAKITYQGFTETQKQELLKEKIAQLNLKIDLEKELWGHCKNLSLVQLRDQLLSASEQHSHTSTKT